MEDIQMPSRQICFRFASVFFILIMTSHAWAVPGQLDNTFGINGVAMDGLASHPTCSLYPADTAQQADGSILVAGWYDSGTQLAKLAQVLLRRYQPNGFYDPHFGMDGFAVASNVPGLPVEVWGIGKAVAVQPDGKILVAGLSYANSGDLQDTRMTVWRFTSTGILDTTFGNDGIALIYSPTVGSALALSVYQGKIIVATRIVQGAETDTVLFRLNSDGSLDTSVGC
jgi:uncharacterized delta-60 repeat protein